MTIERVITEFGFEKNGMRFPTHVEITRLVFGRIGSRREKLRESMQQRVTQD